MDFCFPAEDPSLPYSRLAGRPMCRRFKRFPLNKLSQLLGTCALALGLSAPGQTAPPRVQQGVVDPVAADVPEDPELAKVIAPFAAGIQASFGRVIGYAPVELAKGWPQGLSPLGSLVAEVMRREAARTVGGEVRCAFTNSGSIRRNIPAGPVPIEIIFEALPFENELVVAEYTGAEVVAIVEEGILHKGGEPSSGVQVSVSGAAGHPVASITWSDGTPIDPKGLYRVATTDYLLANGDSTPTLKRGRHVVLTSKAVRQMVIDDFERLNRAGKPIRAPQGDRYLFSPEISEAIKAKTLKF
jgi:2',3'-cyclic-nucleotide 2'-phosphodiesterase (5'-nucleotidase family)